MRKPDPDIRKEMGREAWHNLFFRMERGESMFVHRRFAAFLFLVLLGLSAQALSQSKNIAPGFKGLPAGAQVILMPLDVELFSISAGGVLEPQAQWTDRAVAHMRGLIGERKEKMKVRLVEFEDSHDETVEDLQRLHGAVGNAIAFHHFGMLKLPTKEGKLNWTLGKDAQVIRQRTGADYALFTFVRDSYASSERVAAMVVAALFGVGLGGGVQAGYASLVDLETGDVVWFNLLLRGTGDLREREPARESVNALLTNFPE